MFKEYDAKGNEIWEVFAWCVRDAMAKAGEFQVTNVPVRAKLALYRHINDIIKIKNFEDKTIEEIVEEFN